jgi:hypothetical protein
VVGVLMSGDQRDPRVDAYLAALPPWQGAAAQRVREIVHDADPDVAETIKRTVQPYFVLAGNICALLGTRDHLNVFLYDGGLAADPHHVITGGHGNSTGRTIAIYEGQPINDGALRDIFVEIIANNRAGGWRALKQRRDATGT